MDISSLFSLNNKTAVVSGAANGLGRQIAFTLAHAGAHIILLDKDESNLKQVAHEIHEKGYGATSFSIDLSDPTAIQETMRNILETQSQPIHILVNNAGIGGANPIESTSFDTARDHIDSYYAVNLRAPWLLSHQVAKHMIQQKIDGSIINISSVCGDRCPGKYNAVYSATKAGLIQLTKSMALELSNKKIRVNAILPGYFNTPMARNEIAPDKFDAHRMIPLGFVAFPEDISATILYLASNRASKYVTGTSLVIDGGGSISSLFNKN